MNAFSIVAGSIIAEALIEYAGMAVKDRKLDWHVIASALIGVGVALAFGADVFELIGMSAKAPYVGMALTGVLISRGSNYIHDILRRLGIKPPAPSKALGDDPAAAHEAEEILG